MMENSKYIESPKYDSSEVPSLIRYISSNEVAGSHNLEDKNLMNDQNQPISHRPLHLQTEEIKTATLDCPSDEPELNGHQRTRSVSISLPAFPLEARMQTNKKRVNFNGETVFHDGLDSSNKRQNLSSELPKSVNFHSQTMPPGSLYQAGGLPQVASTGRTIDRRFDSFKTFSGRLEKL